MDDNGMGCHLVQFKLLLVSWVHNEKFKHQHTSSLVPIFFRQTMKGQMDIDTLQILPIALWS